MIKELIDKLESSITILIYCELDVEYIANRLQKENFGIRPRDVSNINFNLSTTGAVVLAVHKYGKEQQSAYTFEYCSYDLAASCKSKILDYPQFTCDYLIELEKKKTSISTKPVEITLNEARKWYDSDNPVLQMLATRAWGDECKAVGYDEIESRVTTIPMLVESCDAVTTKIVNKLQNIAKYYNGGWTPTNEGTKYFISFNHKRGEWAVIKHESVKYLGLVYFKNGRDAEKAIKILKNDLKLLEK